MLTNTSQFSTPLESNWTQGWEFQWPYLAHWRWGSSSDHSKHMEASPVYMYVHVRIGHSIEHHGGLTCTH